MRGHQAPTEPAGSPGADDQHWLRCTSQVQVNGLTPLGSGLDKKVIQPFLAAGVHGRSLQKPILVIVITDGEPTGEPQGTVTNVIKQAKSMVANSQYGPGAIAFEFAQVFPCPSAHDRDRLWGGSSCSGRIVLQQE